MKAPTQPLPWSVREQIRGYTTGDEHEFVILDANGFWVASFGPMRAEAEFVVEVANEWHRRQKIETLFVHSNGGEREKRRKKR